MILNPFAFQLRQVDRLVLMKHLSVMIRSGIPVAEAIATLAEQSTVRGLRSILNKVLADIQNGKSLAKSFAKYPGIFDQFSLSLIEVGESSGNLEDNLDYLATHLAKDYALRQKIQGALLYPILVLVAATGIGLFVGLVLLPQLLTFFQSFEIELPFTTKVVLAVAVFMRDYGVVASIVGAVVLAGLLALVQLPLIRPTWHWLMLRVPLFGKLMRNNQLARFSRNLGMLLQSGVPAATALEISAKTLSNDIFRADVVRVTKSLKKGTKIADALQKQAGGEFPPITTRMIAVGEKTGNLEQTLMYLGDFYEEEIDATTKNLTNILEPLLLLVIGLVVGFLALAVVSPIYELTGSIQRG